MDGSWLSGLRDIRPKADLTYHGWRLGLWFHLWVEFTLLAAICQRRIWRVGVGGIVVQMGGLEFGDNLHWFLRSDYEC